MTDYCKGKKNKDRNQIIYPKEPSLCVCANQISQFQLSIKIWRHSPQTRTDEENQQTEEGEIANQGKMYNFFALVIAEIHMF